MTPEERAKGVLAAMATPWHGQPMPLSAEGHDPFWKDKEIIAAAIRAAIAEEREVLLPLLQEAEWAARVWTDYPACPWCSGLYDRVVPEIVEPSGHKPDCRWVAVIRDRRAP